jgi:hypothetical protein
MTQFILNLNTQRGFSGITLLQNEGGQIVTDDEEVFGTLAGGTLNEGIVQDISDPLGRVYTLTVVPKG